MAKRSLKATPAGMAISKRAFQRTGWTQEYLASEVGLGTRQSIWKFFSGRPVERHIFIDICFQLDLDWQDIAEPPEVDSLLDIPVTIPSPDQLDSWVQQVRSQLQAHIHSQCHPLIPPLPQPHPLWLEAIYIELDCLPYTTSQRWLEPTDLATSEAALFPSPLFHSQDKRIPSLSMVSKSDRLVILGKPGAGKTTLLKQLALSCAAGKLRAEAIPVFITLHHLFRSCPQESSSPPYGLKSQIMAQLSSSGLAEEQLEKILHQGRVLLLLDGLDEVAPHQQPDLESQIQQLGEAYPKLPILITQRIGTLNYQFPGFEYVELAELSYLQIEAFVKRWFQDDTQALDTQRPLPHPISLGQHFLNQLGSQRTRACQDLARNPLFLTLLCLVFQTQGRFPQDLSRLYRHSLELLLHDWDKAKGVQRTWGTKPGQYALYLKILGQLATLSLEQNQHFYEKSDLLQIIASQLLALIPENIDSEQLQIDSEIILQTLVANTGLITEQSKDIYTFSYPILQKYLVSRKILVGLPQDPEETQLKELAARFTQPHWQEVGLILLGTLPQKQPFLHLLQAQLKDMITQDQMLQKFIASLKRKQTQSAYTALFQNEGLDFWISLDSSLDEKSIREISLDLALYRLLSISNHLNATASPEDFERLNLALNLEPALQLEPELKQGIQHLQQALPLSLIDLSQWWQTHRQAWLEQLRALLIKYRGVGYAWKLSFFCHSDWIKTLATSRQPH